MTRIPAEPQLGSVRTHTAIVALLMALIFFIAAHALA
jgi:hypothetical protein